MAEAPLPVVRVQAEDFDVGAETRLLCGERTDIGAVVSFVGLCRDENGRLDALELEHYPGMAEAEIVKYANEAIARFDLVGLTAVHRFGRIAPGQNIVLVIAAATHRQAAFDGANFVMDYLKTGAPFWKKEHGMASDGNWVAARDADDTARRRWTSG
jgi:molybdopterin synthase catalytic subunit